MKSFASYLMQLALLLCVFYQLSQQFALRSDEEFRENLLESKPFIIGSFNLKNFGPTKANRTDFMETVSRIISKFDIALLQEIQDVKLKSLPMLVNFLNEYIDSKDIVYDFVDSPRLGSSARKEQYAFVYRKKSFDNEIQIVKDFVFDDSTSSIYERPPHVGKFKLNNKKVSIKEFYLANIHTRPSFVFQEVLGFKKVADQIIANENLTDPLNYNIAVIGDYNFACTYINQADREIVRSYLSSLFSWYISDANPTTISKSGCAYDRIMITGNKFKAAVFPNSNRTYRYDEEFNFTLQQASTISDHFPIEIQLY